MDLGNWLQRPEMLRELAAANGGFGAAAAAAGAPKQFIMFDKTGDKGRILFSPTQFYEFPSQPGSGQGEGDGVQANFHHVYREAVASFAELQSLRERSRPFSITLLDINNTRDTDCSSKLSWDAASNHLHQDSVAPPYDENSEDIDALLESDDDEDEECSTGHSPSDVTSDEGGEEIASRFKGDPTRAAAAAAVNLTSSTGGGSNSCSSRKKPAVSPVGKKLMKRKRRDKIKNTVKMLQSLIPGGDNLDVAVVLDEAIRYMKTLQMKVVQLETSRQVKF